MTDRTRQTFLRTFASITVLAAIVFSAGSARADDSVGNDEVALKNGGSIRGTVVASEPGTSVTILELGQKETRWIPWDQVSGVERGKFAPAAPAPSPPSLVPGTPGVVRLHVDSPVPVSIYKHHDLNWQTPRGRDVTLDSYSMVCTSPCDVLVDGRLDGEFSAAGDQAVESGRFRLAGLTGDKDLVVSPGSPPLRSAGYLLLAAGGVAAGLGIFGAVAGAIGTRPTGTGFVQNKGLETAGFVTLGSGVTAMAGAIAMIVGSRTTIDLRSTGASGEVKARWWAGEF